MLQPGHLLSSDIWEFLPTFHDSDKASVKPPRKGAVFVGMSAEGPGSGTVHEGGFWILWAVQKSVTAHESYSSRVEL